MKLNVKYLIIFIIVGFFLVTYYFYQHNKQIQNNELNEIIDLEDSTKIIMSLIASNKLEKVLDLSKEQSKNSVNLLIQNFSPAELALESEVLSQSYPVLLIFYNADQWKNIEKIVLEDLHKIKIVKINVDNLFKIAQSFEIDQLPVFVVMKSRQEINRIDGIKEQELKSAIEDILRK